MLTYSCDLNNYIISEISENLLNSIIVEAEKYIYINYYYNGIKYTGMPYLWGGETSIYEITDLINSGKIPGKDFGVDCSGLINVVYRKVLNDNGYSLLYNDAASYEIIKYCNIKNINEILPGDLIFFAENNKIFHIAIFHHIEENKIYFIDSYSIDGKVELRYYDLLSKSFNDRLFNKNWNNIFYNFGRMKIKH